MRRLVLAVAVLVVLSTSAAADPLGDAAREAVAARHVRDSDLKGAHDPRTPYRNLAADGGVLVGLEVGLGGSPPAERVLAVRPIYRVNGRERTGGAGRQLPGRRRGPDGPPGRPRRVRGRRRPGGRRGNK